MLFLNLFFFLVRSRRPRPDTRLTFKAGQSGQCRLHLVSFRLMIAIAFQVSESFGDCITGSDESLWHFMTIHFQSSAKIRFYPTVDDLQRHDLLSRAAGDMAGLIPIAHFAWGPTSMKERLRLVGGELSIDSELGHGTTVLARVPLGDNITAAGAAA